MNLETYAHLVAGCYAKSEPASNPTGPPPLVVDASWIATAFAVSLRTVRRWDVEAKLPRPIAIDRCIRWRRQEILDWCEAGMPRRHEWEAMREGCSP
ncbi:MAG: hypothetical protein KDA71_07065 [Planctomycetales bacterium]|nr:hypothetical protein [Planctomycetales bacterium]